jgi:hypothetical protein
MWHGRCHFFAPEVRMKRLVALVISVAILAAVAVPTLAQRRDCRRDSRTYTSRSYDSRGYYGNSSYSGNSSYYDNRSYYDYGYDKNIVTS